MKIWDPPLPFISRVESKELGDKSGHMSEAFIVIYLQKCMKFCMGFSSRLRSKKLDKIIWHLYGASAQFPDTIRSDVRLSSSVDVSRVWWMILTLASQCQSSLLKTSNKFSSIKENKNILLWISATIWTITNVCCGSYSPVSKHGRDVCALDSWVVDFLHKICLSPNIQRAFGMLQWRTR